ncbi:MAG: LysR family transcriptional regulator [Rhizobiaceae bacterium]
MRLQYAPVLVAIAEAGSIRRAAEALNKSQPAVTKTLRQAESDLGFAVFHRAASGVEPTELGRKVLTRARMITTEHQRLIDEVLQLHDGETGTISVCVSPIAAVEILPPALSLFRREFPRVEVHISNGLYPSALGPVRDGLTDILVGPTPPEDQTAGLLVEPLFETGTVLVTGENSPWLKVNRLEDLIDANWVLIGPREGPGEEFKRAFRRHGLPAPKVNTISESYYGALSMLESMHAVCNFPDRLLKSNLGGWKIKQIEIVEDLKPMQISLITRAATPLTPAASHLTNCIRRRCSTLRGEAP